MLLALDLGNTSLSAAVFHRKEIVRRFKVPVSEFGALADLLVETLSGLNPREIDRAALATVNPPNAYAVEHALNGVLPHLQLLRIGRDVKVPVTALVDIPEQVGADRLLGALAAHRRVKGACIVVDLGTAITVDVVSAKGEFLGGVIAPGIAISAAALHARTALLPEVKTASIEKVIGKNTVQCIQSGLFWGAIAEVEGLVARVRKEYPAAKKVVATGGDAELIAPRCSVFDEIVPDLVLEGIAWTVEGVPST